MITSSIAIDVSGLCKTYGGLFRGKSHTALNDINLTVSRGSLFGLMGPNGAGKTTFIKALLGIIRPNDGTIKIFGGSPRDTAIKQRIGYMPERIYYPISATPKSFLLEISRLRNLKTPNDEIFHQLGRVGLATEAHRPIAEFSKGMKQRLGLATALLGHPDLLIFDEPTDGIDPLGRLEIRTVIQEEHKRGATIFLNSHLLSEVERICTNVGILHNGKLILDGDIAQLCKHTSSWILRFEGSFTPQSLEQLGLERKEDTNTWYYHTEDRAHLNAVISQAVKQGALLTELVPDVLDLEDLMAEKVGKYQS